MKLLFLFLILSPLARADEKVEKVKTSMQLVAKDRDHLEIPKRIPNLIWDAKGIRLIRRDLGKQKFAVLMKGEISGHKIDSFTYQVDGFEAHPITVVKQKFNIEVPLEKSPAVIRLWLEVTEGKAVKIYTDEVDVRSDIVPGAGDDKQINY